MLSWLGKARVVDSLSLAVKGTVLEEPGMPLKRLCKAFG